MNAVPLEEALGPARRAVADFLEALSPDTSIIVFCHNNADGISAGALFGRALPGLGLSTLRVVPSLRGESSFTDAARARLRALAPEALIVTDLGIDEEGILAGIPTLYVDHHRPHGTPPRRRHLRYRWDPIPNASWIVFELLRPLTDIGDLDWIAAVGAIGDLGENAPWDRLPAIRARYGAKWLREAVTLVNAARRAGEAGVRGSFLRDPIPGAPRTFPSGPPGRGWNRR